MSAASSFPLLVVKFVLLYFAAAGLIIGAICAMFFIIDRVSAGRVRWQARRLQREVDRHLEEVSR